MLVWLSVHRTKVCCIYKLNSGNTSYIGQTQETVWPCLNSSRKFAETSRETFVAKHLLEDTSLEMKAVMMKIIILLLLPFLGVEGIQDELSAQEKLLQRFFGDSRRMAEAIPKKNLTDSKPLDVLFGMVVTHIYSIKSSEQEIDLGIWVSLKFTNELVKWNTSEYPVNYLEISTNRIWIPKLYFLENAMFMPLLPKADTGLATIYPDGFTTVDFPIAVKLTCSMSACLFPADNHICPMTFTSSAHDVKVQKLTYNAGLAARYSPFSKKETGLWKLEIGTFEVSNLPVLVSRDNRISSKLTSKIKLIRKPGYYWLTIVSPIVLISIITFCSVLLPWESGERTSLLITCFLAMIVYLDTVVDTLPKTSDYIPVLVMFLIVVLIFTIVQIALTSLASYYAERAGKGKRLKQPHRNIITFLSRIFCKRNPKKNHIKTTDDDVISLREVSQSAAANGRKISSNSFHVTREISRDKIKARKQFSQMSFTQYTENRAIAETAATTPDEENDAAGVPVVNENGCEVGKECRKACKVIDRLSVFFSVCFLVASPIMFKCLYDGTIKLVC